MKQHFRLLMIVLTISLCSTVVVADLVRPSPSPKQGKIVTNMSIQVIPDPKATEARLQIPKENFRFIRAALGEENANPSIAQRIALSSKRTIVAGLLLFMSLSFAGVWLARSNRTAKNSSRIAAALILGLAMLGAAAVITQANVGPPPGFLWRRLSDNLKDGKTTYGSVNIEIVEDTGRLTLIVPTAPAPTTATNPGGE